MNILSHSDFLSIKEKGGKSVVYNFFTMLKNDEMISIKNETVTIRLTVCNYDSYQDNQVDSIPTESPPIMLVACPVEDCFTILVTGLFPIAV